MCVVCLNVCMYIGRDRVVWSRRTWHEGQGRHRRELINKNPVCCTGVLLLKLCCVWCVVCGCGVWVWVWGCGCADGREGDENPREANDDL